jgi:hypothetical protein
VERKGKRSTLTRKQVEGRKYKKGKKKDISTRERKRYKRNKEM